MRREAYKIMNKDKVSEESKGLQIAHDKGDNSTDLLESIVAVEELGLIEKELHKVQRVKSAVGFST